MLYDRADALTALGIAVATLAVAAIAATLNRRRRARERDLARTLQAGPYAPHADYPPGIGPLELDLAIADYLAARFGVGAAINAHLRRLIVHVYPLDVLSGYRTATHHVATVTRSLHTAGRAADLSTKEFA